MTAASGAKPVSGTVERLETAGFTTLASRGVARQRVRAISALDDPRLT